MARRAAVHETVTSRKAPKPIGPYVQAVRVVQPGQMLFISGQIPIEANGQVFLGDIKRQAEIALGHVRNIVQDAKFSMDELVKVTIYITDMNNFAAINGVYEKLFVGGSLPARAVVEVAGLPKGVGVEVDAIAVKRAEAASAFRDEDFV